ncbi:PEBP-like protein [Stipitochalara longipes BDJ]|nr:PEBP-like protein [Stipitochalara longipes BDJ]
MGLPPFIEGTLGHLLSGQKGRDAKLFTNTPPFSAFPEPTIPITSPDCGASGSAMDKDYSQLGSERFPLLKWPANPEVKEWLVIVEDPDAPLPSPIVHGLYFGIEGGVTEFGGEAIVPNGEMKGKGFRVGKNRKGNVYLGPRPVLGHGVHRYMFDVVGLREGLVGLSECPTKEEFVKSVEGKVVGWGRWMGTFERKWE